MKAIEIFIIIIMFMLFTFYTYFCYHYSMSQELKISDFDSYVEYEKYRNEKHE